MKVITIRSQILEVADKWQSQYGSDKTEILCKLKELNKKTAIAKDVEEIIGNSSWACVQRCNECKQYFFAVVEIGDEPDYESSTATICLKCLKKAINLIESALDHKG